MEEYTGIKEIDRRIHRAEVRVNNCGNVEQEVEDFFFGREYFDCGLDAESWKVFKTRFDRKEFGVWVSPEELRLVRYKEGTVTYTQCCHTEGYNREIAYLCGLDFALEERDEKDAEVRVEIDADGAVTITQTFPARGDYFAA